MKCSNRSIIFIYDAPRLLHQSLNQNDQDQHWQNELEVVFQAWTDLESGTGICLCQILIEAPAPFRYTEQEVDEGTDRQQQIADQKILCIQDVTVSDQVQVAPDVVAEDTWHAGDQDDHAVDQGSFPAGPAKHIHTEGHDIFKDGDDCGEAGKGHEQEEQGSPDPAAVHMDKHVWQGDEDQFWTGANFDAVAEAGWENDQTGHDRYEGIKRADADAFACQCIVPAHIAAEDLHSGNAKTKGEECLVHGGGDDISKSDFTDSSKIRDQVEAESFAGTGQGQAVYCQYNDQQQQGAHHEFTDLFQTVLQSHADDQESGDDGENHPESHLFWVGQQPVKDSICGIGIHSR